MLIGLGYSQWGSVNRQVRIDITIWPKYEFCYEANDTETYGEAT